ncbi:MAG: hypothetical protein QOI11_2404 [Candidatus Eremiobacteraeota bacterium]|jgi:hypothetical protein|nr:hypothetical protein [Candidatus Eremiobacteraeota bacterium]
MRRALTLSLAVLAAALGTRASADPGERISALSDQRAVGITIYNAELALVRDRRHLTLPRGESRLALRDVSAKIQPETALLQSVGAPDRLTVLEQNFDYDLLSPDTLLRKYVGRQVEVIRTDPRSGVRTRERATVLATNGGVVLRYADRIETALDGRLAFPALPGNLRDRPTLVSTLDNAREGAQDVELTYLSGGLDWKADYTALLAANDERMDLRGLITLKNESGTSYRDAAVQLVAGDVNVVRSAFQPAPAPQQLNAIGRTASRAAQEALLEYHLYTLPRRTTVADNQTKQVELLSAPDVAVSKTLELRGQPYYYRSANPDLGTRLKVGTYVSFRNQGGALGVPLPKGAVRVYKRDSAGTAQFVGSDAIDHTPKGETVRLHLGDSFDVTAQRKQTDYRAMDERTFESAYQIVLRNAKKSAETVQAVEPIPGDWTMLESSAPYVKSSAASATWSLRVPAEGETTLAYRVRTRF